jgi:hypothetical protein
MLKIVKPPKSQIDAIKEAHPISVSPNIARIITKTNPRVDRIVTNKPKTKIKYNGWGEKLAIASTNKIIRRLIL